MCVSNSAKRGGAAALSVVVAAASGVATNAATSKPTWGWCIALVVLVVVGAGLQIYLTLRPNQDGPAPVAAQGPASVAIGGSSRGKIKTQSSGTASPSSTPSNGIIAQGPGSVAIGGDNESSIETDA